MRRWLFADQLGPEFLDDPKQPVLLIESKAVFRRRRFHRQKAHLILSALRHRAAELGDQAMFLQTETYREALAQVDEPLTACGPTSRGADRFVRRLPNVEVLPERGYGTTKAEFAAWTKERGGRRLLMEDFYRNARLRHGLLMDGDEPAGGKWNLDHDNREPPPKGDRLGVKEPYWPTEDEIDEQVRADLDRWEREDGITFVGADGPRLFAATRSEALSALRRFISGRLATFGPYEDAMLAEDWTMAHSLLSAPMNLGLISPVECAQRAEQAYRKGEAPLQSVEGYVRQLIGWRDYIWNIYWHVDEDLKTSPGDASSKESDQPDYRSRNYLDAHEDLPAWFANLDADAVEARCLSDALRGVRDRAWVHHIPRLMVLGNYALQRGWDPEQLTDWFHRCFIDGYDWVMLPNIVGMSQHADGGLMATKPYAAGGAYINRMSDYCSGCAFAPSKRLGDDACPYTAGYWWFLARNESRLSGNARMRQPLFGLKRLKDVPAVVAQEEDRANAAPRVVRSGEDANEGVRQPDLHE
ncbi:MAG TPA: cryptochrome/photolyase family protein [Frankiaceae bacterium]|nr:cryptochrome/photolyase family protein [Frankiaceae bacterium]